MRFIRENKDSFNELDCCTSFSGTLRYAPREILQGDLRNLSLKSDIYSFGVLMWEVFTQKRPLEGMPDINIINFAGSEDEEMLKPYSKMDENGCIVTEKIPFIEQTPEEINNLIDYCLDEEMEKRPAIDEIISLLIYLSEKYCSAGPILNKFKRFVG